MTKPTDTDLIAAFLAKKAPTVVEPGRAYGVDTEADKLAAKQLRKAKAAHDRDQRMADAYDRADKGGRKPRPVKPNWKAQAAYDAEWGTINGYAPEQYTRNSDGEPI